MARQLTSRTCEIGETDDIGVYAVVDVVLDPLEALQHLEHDVGIDSGGSLLEVDLSILVVQSRLFLRTHQLVPDDQEREKEERGTLSVSRSSSAAVLGSIYRPCLAL